MVAADGHDPIHCLVPPPAALRAAVRMQFSSGFIWVSFSGFPFEHVWVSVRFHFEIRFTVCSMTRLRFELSPCR